MEQRVANVVSGLIQCCIASDCTYIVHCTGVISLCLYLLPFLVLVLSTNFVYVISLRAFKSVVCACQKRFVVLAVKNLFPQFTRIFFTSVY